MPGRLGRGSTAFSPKQVPLVPEITSKESSPCALRFQRARPPLIVAAAPGGLFFFSTWNLLVPFYGVHNGPPGLLGLRRPLLGVCV